MNDECHGNEVKMTILETPVETAETMGDLLRRLGDISPDRIRMHPTPGTATETDVIAIEAREHRLFELVDGVLVEKGMGYRESLLAFAVGGALRNFVIPKKLGLVSGPDGMMKLFGTQVRMPDVGYISRAHLPGGRVPTDAIPRMAPDLAVEVLNESNTKKEMARKREEYFSSGTALVWEVDSEARTVTVYTAPEESRVLMQADTLGGGSVLPGFTLVLGELFAELDN